MAKGGFLWKSWWKSWWVGCEVVVGKSVGKSKVTCSGCSVWWKCVRFCEFVFGFWEKCSGSGGKVAQIRNRWNLEISTFSLIST